MNRSASLPSSIAQQCFRGSTRREFRELSDSCLHHHTFLQIRKRYEKKKKKNVKSYGHGALFIISTTARTTKYPPAQFCHTGGGGKENKYEQCHHI